MRYYFLVFIFLALNLFGQIVRPAKGKQNLAEREKIVQENKSLAEKQETTNQQAFDVHYYGLDLLPDPFTHTLTGSVEIRADVTGELLDHVELNFWDGMTVKNISPGKKAGSPLGFSALNDLLTVNLDRSYMKGESFSFTIYYTGQPQNSPYGSFDFGTHNNQPMIWTLSQPFGARAWWPCKDVPSDKADSVDIRVTVPSQLIVASNGTLAQKITDQEVVSYRWQERYPISTYLVFIAIHPFTVTYDDYIYDQAAATMPIHFYLFEENNEKLFSLNAKTKDMISHFSSLFGEYPFVKEKYGHADFLGGGAMEHQTCSCFSFWDEWVVAHELAHQWWGNMITCSSFHHIWLNEGFASYSEALWYEHLNGPGTASAYQMTENLYLGPGTVYVEDPENENIFNLGLSYSKSSWVLHMLRHVVGEDIFFKILKAYHDSDSRYNSATTEQFQAICEQVSGMNLEKFFHQWIYEEGYPAYTVFWQADLNSGHYDLTMQIKQKQTNYIFWMPLDISVKTATGVKKFSVTDSLALQEFKFSLQEEPLTVEIDPDNWVLKTVQEELVNPAFNKGILLVNGVNFDVYGEEIVSAYKDKAFWGDFQIAFWDCFPAPADGYPQVLPAPIGHGAVPVDILSQFTTVIWIGNNFQGDLNAWYNTSIFSYLEAGGNLLLLTRLGQEYLDETMRSYLGITWAEQASNTIINCVARYEDFTSMSITGLQSLNAVFEEELTGNESYLLFSDTSAFAQARGLGVWKKPLQGGKYKQNGGQFAFISGRPYRFEHNQLQTNISIILKNLFNEKAVSDVYDSSSGHSPQRFNLKQNYPNPFNPRTTIKYELPAADYVELKIHDILGKEVVTLVDGPQIAGKYNVNWDAHAFASGIYYYRLRAGDFIQTRKLVLLK